ncbi:MAG TPA: magnesium transporter CorA family protein [Aldersonia sp.]
MTDTDSGSVSDLPGSVRSRVYRDGKVVAQDVGFEQLVEFRSDESASIWVDLLEPSGQVLSKFMGAVAGDVELRPYLLDRLLSARGRPRVLRFADHKVVHTKAANFDTATRRLRTTDVVVLVFHRWLVTLRSGPGFRTEGVLEEWDDNADLAHEGVAFLLHGVLGELIDGYLDVLDDLDEEINDVEDDLLDGSGPGRSIQVRTFELRRAVAALSRIALPMTEVVAVLTRGGPGETAMGPLLQDVYQHAIRSAERIDGLRDSIESILSTSLAMQGNSLNEIMKKLTAWAAIIAIPTGVTGYFGQNVPFPGFGQASGFWFSAVLLVSLALGLYVMFKRRNWL